MPEYDWIESDAFRNAIRSRIEERLAHFKVAGLPQTFSNMLVDIAKANKAYMRTVHHASLSPLTTWV